MSTPGPKPKPRAVKAAEGNPGKRRLQKRKDPRRRQERFKLDAPDWLDRTARLKFCEIRDFLMEKGVLERIDKMMIAIASQDYSDWLSARKVLGKMTGANRWLVKAGSGVTGNPLLWVIGQKVDSLRRFSALFGLTPSDRNRLGIELDETPIAGKMDELDELMRGAAPGPEPADVTIQ